MPMTVAVSSFELHLPSCRSLKEKRRVVKSLVDRLHQRYRVSIAETGFHDLHQRAEISLAAVATGEAELEKMMEEMRSIVDNVPEAFLTRWEPQILEADR
jgi:uncharacterized protein YlxP (DUF503 family)